MKGVWELQEKEKRGNPIHSEREGNGGQRRRCRSQAKLPSLFFSPLFSFPPIIFIFNLLLPQKAFVSFLSQGLSPFSLYSNDYCLIFSASVIFFFFTLFSSVFPEEASFSFLQCSSNGFSHQVWWKSLRFSFVLLFYSICRLICVS